MKVSDKNHPEKNRTSRDGMGGSMKDRNLYREIMMDFFERGALPLKNGKKY